MLLCINSVVYLCRPVVESVQSGRRASARLDACCGSLRIAPASERGEHCSGSETEAATLPTASLEKLSKKDLDQNKNNAYFPIFSAKVSSLVRISALTS